MLNGGILVVRQVNQFGIHPTLAMHVDPQQQFGASVPDRYGSFAVIYMVCSGNHLAFTNLPLVAVVTKRASQFVLAQGAGKIAFNSGTAGLHPGNGLSVNQLPRTRNCSVNPCHHSVLIANAATLLGNFVPVVARQAEVLT